MKRKVITLCIVTSLILLATSGIVYANTLSGYKRVVELFKQQMIHEKSVFVKPYTFDNFKLLSETTDEFEDGFTLKEYNSIIVNGNKKMENNSEHVFIKDGDKYINKNYYIDKTNDKITNEVYNVFDMYFNKTYDQNGDFNINFHHKDEIDHYIVLDDDTNDNIINIESDFDVYNDSMRNTEQKVASEIIDITTNVFSGSLKENFNYDNKKKSISAVFYPEEYPDYYNELIQFAISASFQLANMYSDYDEKEYDIGEYTNEEKIDLFIHDGIQLFDIEKVSIGLVKLDLQLSDDEFIITDYDVTINLTIYTVEGFEINITLKSSQTLDNYSSEDDIVIPDNIIQEINNIEELRNNELYTETSDMIDKISSIYDDKELTSKQRDIIIEFYNKLEK